MGYSRDDEGKILTSSQEFSAKSCNQATAPKISWTSEKTTPAGDVELKLKGNSKAYCGYSVVDKSVDLVSNPNKVTSPKLQVNIIICLLLDKELNEIQRTQGTFISKK